jgi:hypothetical protein
VDDDDDEEWKAEPKVIRGPLTKRNKLNAAHADDLPESRMPRYYTRTLITKSQAANSRKIRTRSFRPRTTSEALFAATLGEEEEFVRAFAVKAGLTRTLASLNTLHLVAGMNAYDVFEMDKRCASLDPSLRANFRADLLEKKHQARFEEGVVVAVEAVGAKQSQKQPKEKAETTRKDFASEAGHHLQSDEEAREEIPRRNRNQKRFKEKGETIPEDAAGEAAHQLYSNEEAYRDALNKKRLQNRLKKKGEMTHEDGTGEPVHHLHSDEEASEDAPSKKRLQKRLKEKGETTHEDVAGKIRHHLLSDEEAREDTLNKKRPQKRLKEETTPKGTMDKARHHLQSGEEAHEGIPNGKQLQKRLKNKGRARGDNASEDRHQSQSDEGQEENARETNMDGKRLQKRTKDKEEETREVVADDDRGRDIPLASVKRKGAVSSQHPSRTRKLNGHKEPLRRSSSPGASHSHGHEEEDSSSLPVPSSRSKRGQTGTTTTLSKSEAKPKSLESEKKAAVPRRTMAGSKKQSGFLRGPPDIPNHSFTKAERQNDTETKAETDIGAARSEKANNALGSNRNVSRRTINDDNNDDDEGKEVELEAGVSQVTLFEPDAEDSSTAYTLTNQASPTSPASPTTPTDPIHPPRSNAKEDKTFQEANTSVEVVTMGHKTAEYAEGAFQKSNEVFKETNSTFQEASSTTRKTTIIIQETTPSPRIQMTWAQIEQKPQVSGELANAIITANDVADSTMSATAVDGPSSNNADTVVLAAVLGTDVAKTTTNTTTTATATIATKIPDTIATTVRKGSVKIVRSSPLQTIVKEIVDNSKKANPKLSTSITAAATQEQSPSNEKTEPTQMSPMSSSSSLTPVSLTSISSTDSSVSRHDDDAMATPAASKAGGRSHRSRVEVSGVSSSFCMVNTEEPTIGRRRRTNSRM